MSTNRNQSCTRVLRDFSNWFSICGVYHITILETVTDVNINTVQRTYLTVYTLYVLLWHLC